MKRYINTARINSRIPNKDNRITIPVNFYAPNSEKKEVGIVTLLTLYY